LHGRQRRRRAHPHTRHIPPFSDLGVLDNVVRDGGDRLRRADNRKPVARPGNGALEVGGGEAGLFGGGLALVVGRAAQQKLLLAARRDDVLDADVDALLDDAAVDLRGRGEGREGVVGVAAL
jgi:hypothetical protein